MPRIFALEPPKTFGRRSRGQPLFIALLMTAALTAVATPGAATPHEQQLIASDPSWHASFGRAIDTSGERMLIGAPGSKAVYAFERTGGTWTETQKLTASDDPGSPRGTEFGRNVSVDGTDAAIGAYAKVYVFAHNGTDWVEQQIIAPAGIEEISDVAVSGNWLVIGTWLHEQADQQYQTFLYKRTNGTWNEVRELAPGKFASGGIGRSVAIDGTTIVATGPTIDPGEAVIFERSGGAWSMAATFTPDGTCCEGARMVGHDVDLDGPHRAIVAATEGAWVLEKENGAWSRTDTLAPGHLKEWDRNIMEVALEGDVALAIAGPWGGTTKVYQFNILEGAWSETREISREFDVDRWPLESAVTLMGDQLAAGAPGALIDGQSQAGAVYIYQSTLTCHGLTPTVLGSPGDDTIVGTAAADVVMTFGGNDVVRGKGGDDTICTGPGDDLLVGGPGDDTLVGGTGSDTVDYSGATQSVTAKLAPGTAVGQGSDTLDGLENVIGSDFDDTFIGNKSRNTLEGGLGNDTLRGKGSRDTLRGGDGNDIIEGGDGWDLIVAGPGDDLIAKGDTSTTETDNVDGGPGIDTISYAAYRFYVDIRLDGSGSTDRVVNVENVIGSPNRDVIVGTDGPNVIKGGAGKDRIDGAGGDDELFGGPGRDTVQFKSSPRRVTVDMVAGTATGDGSDTFRGFESVSGSKKGDLITGDSRNNRLSGSGGHDTIFGGNGKDSLFGGKGNDELYAGDGNDRVDGGPHDDLLFGEAGDDELIGSHGFDVLDGGEGDDRLDGGSFDDVVTYEDAAGPMLIDLAAGTAAGYGLDTLIGVEDVIGSMADDIIRGDDRSNALFGLEGNDTLVGRGLHDLLVGNEGDDILRGGNGDDQLAGNAGEDTLEGGGGYDLADFFSSPAPISADLGTGMATGDGPDTMTDIEAIVGSELGDSLHGDGSSNVLLGIGGNDELYGYAGPDWLEGGDGTDLLDGGAGNDVCIDGESNPGCEEIQNLPQASSEMRWVNRLTLLAKGLIQRLAEAAYRFGP